MHFFEQPCLTGWFYPCSLDDLSQRLARLPAGDTEGLWAVGLVPSTRKNCQAHGRYTFGQHPTIRIYSYSDTLRFKQLPHTKESEIVLGLCRELEYGMTVERQGSRFVCCWAAEDLRRFIVEHVLLHEVGHHVYHRQRERQRYVYCPSKTESEQFAEAYAVRHRAW